jgi:TorA maturation chaperone TorD
MDLFRALAVLAEQPSPNSHPIAEALGLSPFPEVSEYTDLFDFQLYPFASVYLGNEGMLGGEAADRVAGFWRALGQTPPPESDHLSVMLALYAQLIEIEESNDSSNHLRWRAARKAFLWEHLLSWLPVYLSKLKDIATPFYQRWSEILLGALFDEARIVGKQEQVSLHLRESEGLVDPREGEVDEFLQSLLAPARSGMILVRSDFTRAAKQLELGNRIGERKFIIKSLFGQDAGGTLDWLAEEAAGWARRHRQNIDALGETARVWENKAATTNSLLVELRSET